ncbi:MAG: FtsK/SpoIIIE domain-containing protein [Chloroflexota bacterium]
MHANWELLGHTLIAGLPGGGADVVFTSLLAALAARRHPDQLALWTIAPHALFPPPLGDLPQQRNGVIDPADEAGVQATLAEVHAELERRMGAASSLDANTARPDVILAVHELADLPDDNGLLALLSRYGAAHGVRLLAATTRPEAIAEAALDCFRTRLVLRTADEAQSVRLLGQPDAADLAGGGDLFARLEGREPLRLRGFRLAPDYLVHLVGVMRTAFAGPPPETPATSPVPEPAAADPEPIDAEQAPGPGSSVSQSTATAPVAMVVVGPVSPTEPPAYPPPTRGEGPLGFPSPMAPGGLHGRASSRNGVAVATAPSVSTASTAIVPASAVSTAAIVTPVDASDAPALSAPAGVRLTIRCFGELELLGDGRPLTPGTNQRPWELLLYLALQPAAGVSRDTILATFWAEVEQEQANDRLNTALSRLRTLLARALPDLPSDVVRLERDGVCHLDAALVWSDAQEFLTRREAARRQPPAAAAATLEQARALYRGEVFRQPAYAWLDEPGEDALTLREFFEEAYAVLSERLARLYTDLGQPAKAAPLYRELLRREPAIQQLAPVLYRCYQALGDREELLRAHQELDAALARNRRRAEATGEDAAAYRLAPATVAAYEQAFAALEAHGS